MTQVKVTAEALFDTLTNMLADVEAETIRDTVADIKAEAQVDAVADVLEVDTQTLTNNANQSKSPSTTGWFV